MRILATPATQYAKANRIFTKFDSFFILRPWHMKSWLIRNVSWLEPIEHIYGTGGQWIAIRTNKSLHLIKKIISIAIIGATSMIIPHGHSLNTSYPTIPHSQPYLHFAFSSCQTPYFPFIVWCLEKWKSFAIGCFLSHNYDFNVFTTPGCAFAGIAPTKLKHSV